MITTIPDTYKLLSVYGTECLPPMDALLRAGLAQPKQPLSDYARGVLRLLVAWGWVRWNERLVGHQLTGEGEVQLERYFREFGPALTRRITPKPDEDAS